jgi:hypothetical protein
MAPAQLPEDDDMRVAVVPNPPRWAARDAASVPVPADEIE